MLKLSTFRTIIISGLFLFTIAGSKAAIKTCTAPRLYTVPGTPVVVGNNTTAQAPTPFTSPSFVDSSVTDKIVLGVDHLNMTYLPKGGDIVVTLGLQQWDKFNVLTSSSIVLDLKYQPLNPAMPYVDRAVYKFNNAYKFTVTLQSITVGGVSTTTLPANLYIDGDILLERYTSFATAATPVTMLAPNTRNLDCDAGGVLDDIQINWPVIVGAEEYQLEWTFVNDYELTNAAPYKNPSTLKYDFRNNSTRITTSATTYTLNLTFDHGYLLYRVRGIGRDLSNPSKPITGVWSISSDQGNVSAVSSKYYNQQAHESNKNWQYSATYAEEGKKKEVVSYFDGSLRNRQSVTRVNGESYPDDKNTIVGETIYDHQGRPAINVLPVPVTNGSCAYVETPLKFYPNFNRVDATNSYSRIDFDGDKSGTDTCNALVKGMHTSSGASNYYSSSNPKKTGAQAFVPDAELYPFSQIEYTPDNTGRIRRQGGVGKEFQLDKSHATKYYYGWPQQPQLDRLFGSEVGDASHYKKNLVVDANGQVSISYLDQEGRTIATSLAGEAPKDAATQSINIMEPLPSLPVTAQAMNVDLFAKDANGKSSVNLENVQVNAIEFNSQLLVAFPSEYQFNYDITIDKLADPCLKSTVCFNCVYDLEIKVTDDCGVVKSPMTGIHPVKKTIGRFTTDVNGKLVFNTICTTPSVYTNAEAFKLYLSTGNYTVVKKLTVNKEAKDYYVKTYLETVNTPVQGTYVNLVSGCLKTYQAFLDTALAHVNTADCNISCATCVASLQKNYATLDEARDAWVASGNGTALDFDFFLEECNSPCKETSVCASNLEIMLMDVSPEGQYAEFRKKANGDPEDMTLSVFNIGNQLPKNLPLLTTASWKLPKIKINGSDYGVYIKENGTRSRIAISLAGAACVSPSDCTPKVDDCSKVYYDNTTDSYYTYPENLANVADFVANWDDNWAKSLVSYHPEYPYYLSCVQYSVKPTNYTPSVLTSDSFDDLLVHSRTYAEAFSAGLVQASYIPGAAVPSPITTMIKFNVSGNAVKDPFLFGSSFSSYSALLLSKINSYQSGYSMVELAAMGARCGTTYGGATPAAACKEFGRSTSTAELDMEWNLFKNMYLAEKQKLQKQRDDAYAVLNGGYNDCIDNPSYNPFTGSLIPSTATFIDFITSPFFSVTQPCGDKTSSLYRNKRKRFYVTGNLTLPSKSETNYQTYVQTGQCPLAIDVQNLLNALAGKVQLASTVNVSLKTFSEFSNDLYTAVGGGATYSIFNWKATTTTDVLNTTISNGVATCAFTLDKTGKSISSWNDVTGISQIKYTSNSGGIYYFSAVAAIANPSGGTIKPFIYKTITGSTCINLTGCTLQQQCKPNDLATDLSNLWSALRINGQFQSTAVALNNPTYSSFITPSIKNTLITTSNNLVWNYNGTKYEIYEATLPAKKLEIQFTSGSITGVVAFIKITSGPTNIFSVNGINASGATITALNGNVNLINSGTIPVSMGKCALPDPILCKGEAYQIRTDLENLLQAALLKKPFDPNMDLSLSPFNTKLLQASAGSGKFQAPAKYQYIKLNSANDYKELLQQNMLCNCKIDLWHKGKGSLIMKFDALTSLGTLTPYGPAAFDNNYYQFYMVGTYPTGTDTIFGKSCFPIQICKPSIVADTIVSPQVTYVNPCLLQQISIANVNAKNMYKQYSDSITANIADKYNRHCLSAVENFVAGYNDKEYHFTLYYYDQAGNLIKTVPPEGVELVTAPADFIMIKDDRTKNTRNYFTSHRMATTYTYNTLNQLTRQGLPDHDAMNVWDFTLPNGLDNRLKVSSTQFVNSTKGFLTGYIDFTTPTVFTRGYLYTTDDGGANWTKMNNLVASDLKKVQMVTATVGYAVGTNGVVLKTLDGGNSWDMFPINGTVTVNDLYFNPAQPLNGIVIGDNGTVFKTVDGGVTWSASATGIPASITLKAITFDGANFYIAGNDAVGAKLYKGLASNFTTNLFAVGTWTAQTAIQTTDIVKVQMVTATAGFAIATDGNLLKTTDGGVTWIAVPTGVTTGFKDVYFKNPVSGPVLDGVAIIEAVTGQGLIWKTSDGGIKWNLLSVEDGSYYNAFHFYQNDKGYAVGTKQMKRIVISTSTGLADVPLPGPTVTDLTSVYFTDGNKGWIANGTKVYYTITALAASPVWTELSYSGFTIKKLYFNATNNTGLALTTSGKMYTITWNGSTYVFTLINSADTYADFDDNATRIYAFNITGTTNNVKYIDKTAITATSPLTALTSATLAVAPSVSCIHADASFVYIGGLSGILYKGTVTSSVTWTAYSSATTPLVLNDIEAAGTNTIYAVGKEGTLLQTLNGGTLWQTLPTDLVVQFNAIKFNKLGTTAITACKGLIAANSGFAVKTTITLAGAVTYSVSDYASFNGTYDDFNDVAVNTTGTTYIIGSLGRMVYIGSISGGVSPLFFLQSPTAETFNGVCFIGNTTNVLVVGNKATVYTYSGFSWAKRNSIYPPKLNDVSFINPINGYTIGEKNTIRYTSNGGQTWQYVARPASALLMNAVATWAPGKAVIVGTGGYKANVDNTTVTNGLLGSAVLNDIAMIPGKVGYIVGASVSYKTTTDGTSWAALSPATPAVNLRAVHIFRNNHFIAVGDAGNIYCFNGAWVSHKAGASTANFKDVFFHDDRNGYVVGDGGAIFRYPSSPTLTDIWSYATNTTNLWTAQLLTGTNGVTTPSQVNLTTVDFPSRYNGFLGGYFTTGTPIHYSRLINDESSLFSTRFWYDRLGRMVVSQNSKQYNRKATQSGRGDYSYTMYDPLGRITEVGEKTDNSSGTVFAGIFGEYVNGILNPGVVNDGRLLSWINGGSRREVTHTYYDNALPGLTGVPELTTVVQNNLRKRVSSVSYEDVADANVLTYQHATHYSYDIHGNVNTLWQHNKQITTTGQSLKRIDYEYDLISGKVNAVRFQDGKPDAFYHYYGYDDNNRIKEVYTSSYPQAGLPINSITVSNNALWTRDANYSYYAHGPLARVELSNQSQGMDYAYTLQGWIKGVNSNLLVETNDMGGDGLSTGNPKTAKDAFGYTLNYYQGDYAAIDGVKWNAATTRFEAYTASSDMAAARFDLFNGNISAMATTITQPKVYSGSNELPTILPQATSYKYDQLNRIKEMKAYTNLTASTNSWANGSVYAGRYNNKFTYDAAGNILYQERASAAGVVFDKLNYKYRVNDPLLPLAQQRTTQNRLYHVNETNGSAANGLAADDIDDQGTYTATLGTINTANNYSYDEIGNLIADKKEEILRIEWTVYGKIKKIIRTAASVKSDLEFRYDASGNRIAKIEKPDGSSVENGGIDNATLWTTTYYTRDAQGNILTTYKFVSPGGSPSFKVIERNLFGASRIGTEKTQVELISALPLANPFKRTMGLKNFEASNHLGNVLTVFTDKKIPISNSVVYANDFSSSYSPPFTFSAGSVTALTGGRLQVTVLGQYYSARFSNFATISGHTYKITVDIDLASSGNMALFASDVVTGTDFTVTSVGTTATYTNQFTATGALTHIYFQNSAAGARMFYLDNVLIEDLTVSATPVISYFRPEVVSSSDYTAFGAPMNERSWNNYPVNSGLVSDYLWSFAGGSLTESNGSGLNATAVNGAVVSSDRCGNQNAYTCDGVNDYLQVADNSNLDPGNQNFTVSIWVKRLAAGVNYSGNQAVCKWNGTAGTNEWLMSINGSAAGNTPGGFAIEAGTTSYTILGTSVPVINQWYHLVGQRDGDSIRYYVNGVREGAKYVGPVSVNNTGLSITIGKWTSNLYYSNSVYDDFAYFKRALSRDEVRKLYFGTGCNFVDLNANGYRYAFNTQEKVDEISGSGNHTTALFWEYDTRLGRRWNLDPKPTANESSYLVNKDNPILLNDPNGDCPPGSPCAGGQLSVSLKLGTAQTRIGVTVGAYAGVGSTEASGSISILKNTKSFGPKGGSSELQITGGITQGIGRQNSSNEPHDFSMAANNTGSSGSVSLYSTTYVGTNGTNQRVAGFGFTAGNFKASVEDDYLPFVASKDNKYSSPLFGDAEDRFRSAAVNVEYKLNSNLTAVAGFKLFTGDPRLYGKSENVPKGFSSAYNSVGSYSTGIAYGGLRSGSYTAIAGWNSEKIRTGIQNGIHSIIGSPYVPSIQGGAVNKPFLEVGTNTGTTSY